MNLPASNDGYNDPGVTPLPSPEEVEEGFWEYVMESDNPMDEEPPFVHVVDRLKNAVERMEYLQRPGSTLKGYYEKYPDRAKRIIDRAREQRDCQKCGRKYWRIEGYQGHCEECSSRKVG